MLANDTNVHCHCPHKSSQLLFSQQAVKFVNECGMIMALRAGEDAGTGSPHTYIKPPLPIGSGGIH